MENVAHGLTSYFNKLGAVKQLTFLDRDFFYHEMEEHFEDLIPELILELSYRVTKIT